MELKGLLLTHTCILDHLPQTDILSKKGLVHCVSEWDFQSQGDPQISLSLNSVLNVLLQQALPIS